MKKVILTIAIVVFVIAGIALVVMYNMGDRIIEEAIKSDLLSTDTTTANNSSGGSVEKDSTQANQNENKNKVDESSGENASSATTDTASTKKPAVTSDNSKSGNKTSPQTTASGTTPKPAEKTELTTEKINEIKDEVSATDKISAAALVLKRLSPSDINELKDMLAKGLTEADKEKAKELAYSRFTVDEIAKIKEMYEKYMK